jgi:hypothetical protein
MEIRFKATRRRYDSGFAEIEKEGDLEFDHDKLSKDGIWLRLKTGEAITIDCNFKTKQFRVFCDGHLLSKNFNPLN